MDSPEDVTVIVVGYNHAKFVCECLESVRAQTRTAHRVLIADDASSDNSQSVIAGYLAEHPGFGEFYPNRQNIGLTRTLNRMLSRVDTDYVTYIAADDYMLPTRIEQQLSLMRNTLADIAYSDAIVVDSESRLVHQTSKMEFPWPDEPGRTGEISELLLVTNWIPAASLFLRTSLLKNLGGYNEDIFYEDYELLVRLAVNRAKFAYIDEPLVAVRRLESSLGSRQFDSRNPRFLAALYKALENYDTATAALRAQAASKRWELAKRMLATDAPRRSTRAMLLAARSGAGSSLGFAYHVMRSFL